jgi:hypothetical protein
VPKQGSDLGHAPGLDDELRRRDGEDGGGVIVAVVGGGGPDPAGAGRRRDRGNKKESFGAAEGGVHGREIAAVGDKVVAHRSGTHPPCHREACTRRVKRKRYREHRPGGAAADFGVSVGEALQQGRDDVACEEPLDLVLVVPYDQADCKAGLALPDPAVRGCEQTAEKGQKGRIGESPVSAGRSRRRCSPPCRGQS